MAALKTIKSWLYPVTPLTVITPISIGIAIYSIYLGVTLESPAIIYPIIVVPIAVFILVLYVFDRFLIKKKVSYRILLIAELVLIAGCYLPLNYANSTSDIRITTDEDYILVLYDVHENSMDRFKKSGLFSKELLIYNNIVHLDLSLYNRNDIRIFPPDSWKGTYQDHGNYMHEGDSIPYIYMLKTRQANEYARTQQTYIDSLLTQVLQK